MAALIHNLLDGFYCENGASMSILSQAQPMFSGEGGGVDIYCTSYFAEVKVEWCGELYVVMLPLCASAIKDLFSRVKELRHTDLDAIADYRLLRQELSYIDIKGELSQSDIILYRMPCGALLSDFVKGEGVDWHALIEASYQTEELFVAAKVSHNNLKASNIVVTQSLQLLPIRYTDSLLGASREDIHAEFEALREWLKQCGGVSCEPRSEALPQMRAIRYDRVEGEFEGLRCFSRDGLYGYVDSCGVEVIAPIYIWAEHFREGRAEVIADSGMGLINNRGEYVIDPVNQIVEYDVDLGCSRVKRDDMWALFDHNGEQMIPFGRSYISESRMQSIKNGETVLEQK